jgi:hypothetical protein
MVAWAHAKKELPAYLTTLILILKHMQHTMELQFSQYAMPHCTHYMIFLEANTKPDCHAWHLFTCTL